MTDINKQSNTVKPNPILDLIVKQRPAIEAQLAGTINSGAFVRAALSTIKDNERLMAATPSSVLGSIMLAAQLRLEIGPALGHFYLTPRRVRDEWTCIPIIGYRGYITLAYRSGMVEKIETDIVRIGDEFDRGADSERGRWYTWHPKYHGEDARPWIGVFANAKITGAGVVWTYLSKENVMRRMPTGVTSGPWITHEEPMARKTAVRDLSSYLPMSTDLGRALAADEQQVNVVDDEVVITRTEADE